VKPTLKPSVMQWLARNTVYPDAIESAGAETGKANLIKSHHNVGGLPDYLKLELLEPLRELLKDEVRKHDFYDKTRQAFAVFPAFISNQVKHYVLALLETVLALSHIRTVLAQQP